MKRIKPFIKFINELKSDRVMSASDVLKQDYQTNLNFEGKWGDILGNIAPDFMMMVSGEPGSGKTTFLLDLAYYLASNFGKVLYISSEEYGSITLADKLKMVIKDKGLHKEVEGHEKSLIPKDLFFGKGFSDLSNFHYVIIDSVNNLNFDLMDFKEMRDIYPEKGFVVVLQTTKAEETYRGGKDWEHEADIAVYMIGGKTKMFKNRYGKMLCYDYFNEESISCDILDNE